VMVGDGTLLNKDTGNWAPWEPKVGSNDDALEMIRTVTALRRGPGKDFLVYGRMLRPAQVDGVRDIEWTEHGKNHCIPAVFDSAWRAPDGRHGVVLTNWTTQAQPVNVRDARLGASTRLWTSAGQDEVLSSDLVPVTVPPLGCVLLSSM